MKSTWTVALDFTEMDKVVVEYVKFLCTYLKPDKILFVNVVKEMPTYAHLPEEYLEFRNQVIVDRELQLKHRVEKYFKDTGVEISTHILSGNPFDEMIQLVINQFSNLVIAGRKKKSGGSGIVSDRLSRNLPCDFLLIPEGFKPSLQNILISTDFSDHSTLALQKANHIKEADKNVNLFALHIYDVPMGYSKSGKSYEQVAEIMRSNSEKNMTRWLKPFPYEVQSILKLKNKKTLTEETLKTIDDNKIDLVIMGSKGQTGASMAILGSVALKLVWENDRVPLWIVKKEGENLDLLDALKQL